MNEKSSNYKENEHTDYRRVPVPVGSPDEKIAELARADRRRHPVMGHDKLEAAPEFAAGNLAVEAAAIHRERSGAGQYSVPATVAPPPGVNETAAASAQGAAELLHQLGSIVREKPAAALAGAVIAGFAIGRWVK